MSIATLALLVGCATHGSAGHPGGGVLAITPPSGTLDRLVAAVDADGDRRITVEDVEDGEVPTFTLAGPEGRIRIAGVYPLSNLAQELALAEPGHAIELSRIVEHPLDRTRRLIDTQFWSGLTRRMTADGLWDVLTDDKLSVSAPARSAKLGAEQATESTAGRDRERPDIASPLSPARAHAPEDLEGCRHGPRSPEQPVRFLWVAASDDDAFRRHAAAAEKQPGVVVCRLPEPITPEFVQSLDGSDTRPARHGLLALASRDGEDLPYVVPGGRFNELYGWDSYFHVRGLLASGRDALALAVVEHLLYEVEHYGQVLNANRTYYLTRSQPPFLAQAVLAIWEELGGRLPRAWLERAVALAVREHETVWSTGPRRTSLCDGSTCLARYHGRGLGEPPEVEPGHFDALYRRIGRAHGLADDPRDLSRRYRARALSEPVLAALDRAFEHDRCMRESGHDTTYRWFDLETLDDRCADFAPVGLNALLLGQEIAIAKLKRALSVGGPVPPQDGADAWCERAQRRAGLVRAHLYDPGLELFFDFDLRRERRSTYLAATTLLPLWATSRSDPTCPVEVFGDPSERARFVERALQALEAPGGIAASRRSDAVAALDAASASLGVEREALLRQWDHPNGWAPHQVLAWEALDGHGFGPEAQRLRVRWLQTILKGVVSHHGTIPEKFDVVRQSHRVFAEYGNVGTDFAYITREGFGWMNASFLLALDGLSEDSLHELRGQALRDAAPGQPPGEGEGDR